MKLVPLRRHPTLSTTCHADLSRRSVSGNGSRAKADQLPGTPYFSERGSTITPHRSKHEPFYKWASQCIAVFNCPRDHEAIVDLKAELHY